MTFLGQKTAFLPLRISISGTYPYFRHFWGSKNWVFSQKSYFFEFLRVGKAFFGQKSHFGSILGWKNSTKSIFGRKVDFWPSKLSKIRVRCRKSPYFWWKGCILVSNLVLWQIWGQKYGKKSIFGRKTRFLTPAGQIFFLRLGTPSISAQPPNIYTFP